jgi:aspartyl-tRNA(Asn)/glutamyl-tRNA(Gln) amidotransferase subunit A
MSDLIDLTIVEAKKLLANKEISAVDLIKANIEQAKKTKELNAFIMPSFDSALAQAASAQQKIDAGNARSLEGIPVAIKDNYCTKGHLTTACSKMLYNFVSPYESTVTSKLFASGAIMIGKTNMDEFAMGSTNTNSLYGPCINPWKNKNDPIKNLVPGGSSGGSAVAVSSRSAMASLGSDTGGSVRQPAAFNGIVGVKPSYGRCSRYGMIAFASSLDQSGVFARSVADSALILENIMGHGEYDSTVAPNKVPKLSNISLGDIKGLKIGIPNEYLDDNLPEETKKYINQTINAFKQKGAEIKEVSLPHTKYALPVYYIIAPAEASSNLARYDGIRYGYRTAEKVNSIDELYEITRDEGFGDEVKRRIIIGSFVLSSSQFSSHFRKAQQIRTLVIKDFNRVFSDVDVLLTPTTPSAAFAVDAKLDPVQIYYNDIFTIPASLAGLPCISVPVGLDNNSLPIGLQLIANRFDEEMMYRTALHLEEIAQFNHKPTNI